ncbi:hypothetical protein, partial [Streptomyces sp. Act143]|uniref:hypothetical protein n=1 Tax=Streptomyces sp. Act143 TaxID=2200760 RepID=UPI001C634F38
DAGERDNAVNNLGYTDEGIACHVYGAGGANRVPLLRAYKRYGARVRLQLKVVQNYLSEGIACHVFSAAGSGTTPLFRMF